MVMVRFHTTQNLNHDPWTVIFLLQHDNYFSNLVMLNEYFCYLRLIFVRLNGYLYQLLYLIMCRCCRSQVEAPLTALVGVVADGRQPEKVDIYIRYKSTIALLQKTYCSISSSGRLCPILLSKLMSVFCCIKIYRWCPSPISSVMFELICPIAGSFVQCIKGALYRIWCGVNRLGDSGVKVVWIDSAILQLLLSRRVSH